MAGMKRISREDLETLQRKYHFKFCRIVGTDVVNICKSMKDTMEEISFNEFWRILNDKNLAVFKSDRSDYLRIMKK